MRRKGVDGALIGIGGDGSARTVKAGGVARKGMSRSALRTLTHLTIVAAWMFLVLLFFVAGASAGDYKLPDTGQHKCYSDDDYTIHCPEPGEPFYGQDSQYQGAEPALRDNGDGTVTDLNTGLMWQQGDEQNAQGRDWQDAVDYCAGLDLAGYTDWRLPNRRELVSLVNYGWCWPAIDIQYFPGVRQERYWSSTTKPRYLGSAWGVAFGDGYVDWVGKGSHYYVRCVRAGS